MDDAKGVAMGSFASHILCDSGSKALSCRRGGFLNFWHWCIRVAPLQGSFRDPASSIGKKQKDKEKVFHQLYITPTSVEALLDEWMKAAGIPKNITYHCSRHTAATMLLTLGADLYTVSKILGHSSIKTTEVYAKIVDKKKVETVNLVNNLFNQ